MRTKLVGCITYQTLPSKSIERADGLHLGESVGGKKILPVPVCVLVNAPIGASRCVFGVCVHVGATAGSWLWPLSKVVCVCVCVSWVGEWVCIV